MSFAIIDAESIIFTLIMWEFYEIILKIVQQTHNDWALW